MIRRLVLVALGAAAFVVYPGTVDAHQPGYTATCAGARITGVSYETADINIARIFIDGVEQSGGELGSDFGGDIDVTVPVPQDAASHQVRFTITVTDRDGNGVDPGWLLDVTVTVGPCTTTTTTEVTPSTALPTTSSPPAPTSTVVTSTTSTVTPTTSPATSSSVAATSTTSVPNSDSTTTAPPPSTTLPGPSSTAPGPTTNPQPTTSTPSATTTSTPGPCITPGPGPSSPPTSPPGTPSSPPCELPATGQASDQLAEAAVLLTIVGAGVVLAARRRAA